MNPRVLAACWLQVDPGLDDLLWVGPNQMITVGPIQVITLRAERLEQEGARPAFGSGTIAMDTTRASVGPESSSGCFTPTPTVVVMLSEAIGDPNSTQRRLITLPVVSLTRPPAVSRTPHRRRHQPSLSMRSSPKLESTPNESADATEPPIALRPADSRRTEGSNPGRSPPRTPWRSPSRSPPRTAPPSKGTQTEASTPAPLGARPRRRILR